MGCGCKQKKTNNLDNKNYVNNLVNLYNQSLQEDNGFEVYWNDIYAAFMLIFPNNKKHTKDYIKEQTIKIVNNNIR